MMFFISKPYLVSRMYLMGRFSPLSPSTATTLHTKSPILLFSGNLVTGGAERNMGGESATFSTLMMNSWTATFLESVVPSTQAFCSIIVRTKLVLWLFYLCYNLHNVGSMEFIVQLVFEIYWTFCVSIHWSQLFLYRKQGSIFINHRRYLKVFNQHQCKNYSHFTCLM